jgi:cell division protein ZapA (FtsZ GTPase activity inhibitor)
MTDQNRSVSVWIRGQEFRILSDDDHESLQRVAHYLDETMGKVEQRTGTVDSLDVALLTALNLARELVGIREGRLDAGTSGVDPGRLRGVIELAESALTAEAD